MSDPENFLARWSRRKRETAEDGEDTKAPAQPTQAAAEARVGEDGGKLADIPAASSAALNSAEPAFDLTRLPPLESITAASDIRPFLASGVPPDLTRAALRRAWAADPKIRDFVGLADYDWDYHAPGSMAGFGPLEMTDELRRLVARIVGGEAGEGGTERPNPTTAAESDIQTSNKSDATAASTADRPTQDDSGHLEIAQDEPAKYNSDAGTHKQLAQPNEENIASQHNLKKSDDLQTLAKRPHGRALPK